MQKRRRLGRARHGSLLQSLCSSLPPGLLYALPLPISISMLVFSRTRAASNLPAQCPSQPMSLKSQRTKKPSPRSRPFRWRHRAPYYPARPRREQERGNEKPRSPAGSRSPAEADTPSKIIFKWPPATGTLETPRSALTAGNRQCRSLMLSAGEAAASGPTAWMVDLTCHRDRVWV